MKHELYYYIISLLVMCGVKCSPSGCFSSAGLLSLHKNNSECMSSQTDLQDIYYNTVSHCIVIECYCV